MQRVGVEVLFWPGEGTVVRALVEKRGSKDPGKLEQGVATGGAQRVGSLMKSSEEEDETNGRRPAHL